MALVLPSRTRMVDFEDGPDRHPRPKGGFTQETGTMAAQTREQVAEEMARWHFTVEPTLKKILWVAPHTPYDGPVRLLEVATERRGMERGIEVFAFDRTDDVPYPTEVAEITEREFNLVVAGQLSLPEGWMLDGAKPFTRDKFGLLEHEPAAE